VHLITGSATAAARRGELADLADGTAGIIIGTHTLLSEQVTFADLGLVVVDEQHRFGVEQRDTLRTRAETPAHLLVMTATPIPRTVAMTVFGDLTVSTLTELPAGRGEVVTHVVPAHKKNWLDRVWQVVTEQVAAGGRAYVVCPRIDPNTGDDGAILTDDGASRQLTSVIEMHEVLRAQLPYPVGLLHGQMTSDAKDAAMYDFSTGRTPVLVATTVVEVGVDVPEATVMVVMNADRFGISQLHQLRGRIGRADRPGTCFLVADAPDGTPAAQRLAALASTRDGFALAALDVQIRREGDVLGAAQSGGSSLRWLRLAKDEDVIRAARDDATALVEQDPTLASWPDLRDAVLLDLDPDSGDFLTRA
jgi:ATP-dependent DNA helicase RecG